MAFAYRYLLDGNGPYESEKFDTENDLEQAAAERGHNVEETISFDSDGNPSSDKREVINLDTTPAQEVPTGDPTVTQEHTDGTQPA